MSIYRISEGKEKCLNEGYLEGVVENRCPWQEWHIYDSVMDFMHVPISLSSPKEGVAVNRWIHGLQHVNSKERNMAKSNVELKASPQYQYARKQTIINKDKTPFTLHRKHQNRL